MITSNLAFEGDLSKPEWVKKAEQLLNNVLGNSFHTVTLEARYNRAGGATTACWLARFSPVSQVARAFAVLQDAGYFLEVTPPHTQEEVFENYRKVIIRPAPKFEKWMREVAPASGKGSLLNRKTDGVPQHWLVLGWFYDLLLKETLPRLIVRQISSLARYNGLYYLASFTRENSKYRREIVTLHRNAPHLALGKTNPYRYFYPSADAEREADEDDFQLLQSWKAELASITRSRRNLFGLHRQEEAVRRLAVQRLAKASLRPLQ